jgi:Protein of unknown function (DUF4031)
MAVYVDPLFACALSANWRWRQSCHMWGDNESELHAFASRIGLRREWYQGDKTLPHYDLTPGRRRKAVALGAVEVSRDVLVAEIRKRRGL